MAAVRPEERRVAVAPDVALRTLTWSPAERGAAAPAFLLVHGLASNALLWCGVGEALAAAGHVAVAVDQRGHGASDRGPADAVADLGVLVSDLIAVAAALDLDRPVVVGQSWGGNVVMELARRRPEVVLGVVGVDGGTLDLARAFPDWERCRAALTPPRLAGLARDELVRRMRLRFAGWPAAALEGQLANFDVRPDGTVAPHLALDDHLAILRRLWEHRPAEVLPDVRVPVLLLPVGDDGPEDRADGRRGALEVAAGLLDDVRVRWFDGYDHDVHAQAPDLVAAELLRSASAWLATQEGAAS